MQSSLADYPFGPRTFDKIDEVIAAFGGDDFLGLNRFAQNSVVNKKLCALIQGHKERRFLLTEVIDFIARVNEAGVLSKYTIADFELWLDHFSEAGCTQEIRDLIAGKAIPRDEYQAFFPIAMGKKYPGSHFVTAHSSPDLDTIIGSFWGWLDAFSAQVSHGVHVWNVPGGPPSPHVEIELLFKQLLGKGTFKALAKTRTELTLSSVDLMTQEGFLRKKPYDLMLSTYHERNQNAVVMVDDSGYYKGDWRPFDVEGVRQVIMLLNNCMRWLESQLHVRLISLFAKKDLEKGEFSDFIQKTFGERIRDLEPVREYSTRQLELLDKYLTLVLGCKEGMETTINGFAKAMTDLGVDDLETFHTKLAGLAQGELFDKGGKVSESRPLIFKHLEKVALGLEVAFRSTRYYMESLGVGMQIKSEVFGFKPQSLSHRTDIQEVRSKMASYPYLTVTLLDKEGERIPLGVIQAKDLKKGPLGTVTLRDFSNHEETKIPDFLEVISVIDHHKTSLTTQAPPMVLICDAQSSNALIAELALSIYDKYSTAGMTREAAEKQLRALAAEKPSAKNLRLQQRLMNRLMAFDEKGTFVSPEREFVEYLHYLFGILDDTDLLTKVSRRDVVIVAKLLGRLKTLQTGIETELVDYDDLPRDTTFVRQAAERLLQNEELYALYSRVYARKEQMIEENLVRCSEGLPSSIFVDTKTQNGCCRVGQTKVFAKNYARFAELAPDMRKYWIKHAKYLHREQPGIDLHLHATSTIASAEELHSGNRSGYAHKDEMWFWIPFSDLSIEHLKLFLNAFKKAPEIENNDLTLEVFGSKADELATIFRESFLPIPMTVTQNDTSTAAVLHFRAGSINSRKSMITPYLPKVLV